MAFARERKEEETTFHVLKEGKNTENRFTGQEKERGKGESHGRGGQRRGEGERPS